LNSVGGKAIGLTLPILPEAALVPLLLGQPSVVALGATRHPPFFDFLSPLFFLSRFLAFSLSLLLLPPFSSDNLSLSFLLCSVYTLGAAVEIECKDISGKWGPGPICRETGSPLRFQYGTEMFFHCTISIDQQMYQWIREVVDLNGNPFFSLFLFLASSFSPLFPHFSSPFSMQHHGPAEFP
jgi:hypothetical protein